MNNEKETFAGPINRGFAEKYFKEKQDMMDAMSLDEMRTLLMEWEQKRDFIAYIKYIQFRLSLAENILLTGDPVQDPTPLTRCQGIISGLLDPLDAIVDLKEKRKKADQDAVDKSQGKTTSSSIDDLGGAYGKVVS